MASRSGIRLCNLYLVQHIDGGILISRRWSHVPKPKITAYGESMIVNTLKTIPDFLTQHFIFIINHLHPLLWAKLLLTTGCPFQIIIIIIIPADRNVVQKEAEKKLKYKSLCKEIQRMWNLKCTIVPVIIGATGIVTRSLRKNLETIPGRHSTDSLQKTAILGTSHIIRKVLQCEV